VGMAQSGRGLPRSLPQHAFQALLAFYNDPSS
jgi:hypothetical protein